MATSPNYGWSEPDNTSLVKDGALAMRNLGDAIDTSVWNVGFGQAGKNKIINGNFAINQRNFTTDSVGGYGFDRFICAFSGATATATAQTFTLGTAPVTGYEAKNFLRLAVTTGNDYCRVAQSIESVRTFAGQTATLSFWAKGTNPTTAGNLKTSIVQNFGTGGSPSTQIRSAEQTFVLTANWTRYSFTFAVPSISGKTIGTNNDDRLEIEIGQISSTSADAWTLDLWGVQMEYGSKATPFQTASGSIQGELAMCQRYYQLIASGTSKILGIGYYVSATGIDGPIINLPVEMRTTPTISIVSGTNYFLAVSAGGGNDNLNSVTLAGESTARTAFFYNNSEAAGTAGQACRIQTNNAAAFLAVQAEL